MTNREIYMTKKGVEQKGEQQKLQKIPEKKFEQIMQWGGLCNKIEINEISKFPSVPPCHDTSIKHCHIIMCLLRWRAKWSEREKVRSQSEQMKGLMPVCLRKCRVNSSDLANFHVQPSHVHLYGFSPKKKRRKNGLCVTKARITDKVKKENKKDSLHSVVKLSKVQSFVCTELLSWEASGTPGGWSPAKTTVWERELDSWLDYFVSI